MPDVKTWAKYLNFLTLVSLRVNGCDHTASSKDPWDVGLHFSAVAAGPDPWAVGEENPSFYTLKHQKKGFKWPQTPGMPHWFSFVHESQHFHESKCTLFIPVFQTGARTTSREIKYIVTFKFKPRQ